MAILEQNSRKKVKQIKPAIDLQSEQGNVFYIIGIANKLAKQLEYSKEQIENLNTELMAGDYETLLSVFDKTFGEFIDLQR